MYDLDTSDEIDLYCNAIFLDLKEQYTENEKDIEKLRIKLKKALLKSKKEEISLSIKKLEDDNKIIKSSLEPKEKFDEEIEKLGWDTFLNIPYKELDKIRESTIIQVVKENVKEEVINKEIENIFMRCSNGEKPSFSGNYMEYIARNYILSVCEKFISKKNSSSQSKDEFIEAFAEEDREI